MLTINFHWWYVPIILLIAAVISMWLGSKQYGFFGGFYHFLFAIGCVGGAIVSFITGLIA